MVTLKQLKTAQNQTLKKFGKILEWLVADSMEKPLPKMRDRNWLKNGLEARFITEIGCGFCKKFLNMSLTTEPDRCTECPIIQVTNGKACYKNAQYNNFERFARKYDRIRLYY